MAVKIKCSVCRGTYPWNTKKKWPKFCPLCSADMSNDRADDDIVMPFYRNHGYTKAVDDVYRQMEAGSITRSEIAASMVNCPVSEMSGLKITDLNDHQKPGDLAAKLPSNPVSELMAAAPNIGQGFDPGMGLEFSRATGQGPHPSAGARMRTVLQNQHSASGFATSERPAIETLQPGYRRRG